MVALGDDAAILEGGRRFRVHRRKDAGLDVLQRVDAGRQLGQLRAATALGLFAQAGQTVAGLGQRVDLLRGRGAVDRAGHQALHIRDVAQLVDQVAADYGLLHKAFHGVQAAVDEGAGE